MKKLRKYLVNDKKFLFGVIGLFILIFIYFFAPLLVTHNPYEYGKDILAKIGKNGHLLGTNHLGQDIYSMIIYGTRTSLKVAVISAFISGIIGIIVGGISGYFGGLIDQILSELINIFMMLPIFFLILMIISMFGSSMLNVMIVIGITTWPGNAKLMRAQAVSLRERTFVKSAVVLGESKTQILFKYIIPNGIFPVIANTTVGMANAILTEAGLSFLGLGDPNTISWGQMIFQGKGYLTNAWWVSTFSGLAIVFTVVVFYLLGDGLNNILNPKSSVLKGDL